MHQVHLLERFIKYCFWHRWVRGRFQLIRKRAKKNKNEIWHCSKCMHRVGIGSSRATVIILSPVLPSLLCFLFLCCSVSNVAFQDQENEKGKRRGFVLATSWCQPCSMGKGQWRRERGEKGNSFSPRVCWIIHQCEQWEDKHVGCGQLLVGSRNIHLFGRCTYLKLQKGL